MKFSIASMNGLFGQHYLAEYLYKNGLLVSWFDTRPFIRTVRKFPWVNKKIYKSLSLLEYERQFRWQLIAPWLPHNEAFFNAIENRIFSKWVSLQSDDADIKVFFSGTGLYSLRIPKKKKEIRILFNNSTHLSHSIEVQNSELQKFNLPNLRVPNWFQKHIGEEYERSDFIRVPADYAKKTFISRGFSEKKVNVIPHGYELDIFKPFKKSDDIFRVLYFGTVCIRKGVPYLFESFEKANIPNSELVLVGGIHHDISRFLKKTKIPFKSYGYIPHSRLSPILSQASVMVFLSVEEGSAGTIGQCMACGVPVIASAASGAEPLIRHGIDGFIVPSSNNTNLVADYLKTLYSNPSLLNKMKNNCLNRIKDFSWENHCNLFVEWIFNLYYNDN